MDAKKKRGIRINTPTDVKRLVARTINDVRNSKEISDKEKAQLIATLSNTMLRAMETIPAREQDGRKPNSALAELTGLIGQVSRQMKHDGRDEDNGQNIN